MCIKKNSITSTHDEIIDWNMLDHVTVIRSLPDLWHGIRFPLIIYCCLCYLIDTFAHYNFIRIKHFFNVKTLFQTNFWKPLLIFSSVHISAWFVISLSAELLFCKSLINNTTKNLKMPDTLKVRILITDCLTIFWVTTANHWRIISSLAQHTSVFLTFCYDKTNVLCYES